MKPITEHGIGRPEHAWKTGNRHVARYCQLRFTKIENGVLHVTVRWCPESIANLDQPVGFRMHGNGQWSDGWTCKYKRYPILIPRTHAIWDEWRINGQDNAG